MAEIKFVANRNIQREKIAEGIEELWNDLKTDQGLREIAKLEGIDLQKIDQIEKNPFTLEAKGQGMDPVTIAFAVAFAPVVAEICRDTWRVVFLPRLKRRFGEDLIK